MTHAVHRRVDVVWCLRLARLGAAPGELALVRVRFHPVLTGCDWVFGILPESTTQAQSLEEWAVSGPIVLEWAESREGAEGWVGGPMWVGRAPARAGGWGA